MLLIMEINSVVLWWGLPWESGLDGKEWGGNYYVECHCPSCRQDFNVSRNEVGTTMWGTTTVFTFFM